MSLSYFIPSKYLPFVRSSSAGFGIGYAWTPPSQMRLAVIGSTRSVSLKKFVSREPKATTPGTY